MPSDGRQNELSHGLAAAPRTPAILCIGGSDSSAGAGIQADIKTAQTHNVYATTAITAITAQDTRAVHAIHPVPPALVAAQIQAALRDIGAAIVKTGMLATAGIVAAVAETIAALPLVVDPVLLSTSGATLLDAPGIEALKRLLLPKTLLLTPNLPEARHLAGPGAPADPPALAHALRALGPHAVLLKGGHAAGDATTDWLATPTATIPLTHPRLPTRHTHGTGCALATAIAANLAHGIPLPEAAARARAWLQRAIATAPGLGAGHGPLNHAATPDVLHTPHTAGSPL